MQEEFLDAGIGCNNPIQFLLEEAAEAFGPERLVSCIVSIGTGHPKVNTYKRPGFFQKLIPLDLVDVLRSMATDTEKAASDMKARFKDHPTLYHRFNVRKGLENVTLKEWKKLSEVKTQTKAYLEDHDVSQGVDIVVDALLGKPSLKLPAGQLGMQLQTLDVQILIFK